MEFENTGNALKATILKSQDSKKFIGWIFNQNYNSININTNGIPLEVKFSKLKLNVPNGNYDISFKNTLTGSLVLKQSLSTNSGEIVADIPNTLWDLHIIVEPSVIQSQNNRVRRKYAFFGKIINL